MFARMDRAVARSSMHELRGGRICRFSGRHPDHAPKSDAHRLTSRHVTSVAAAVCNDDDDAVHAGRNRK